MHYSLSWSGGKDSTASVILAHEHNEPIDSIVFAEVMFDKKNNISGENIRHIKFVYETKELFESWGYKVHIVRSEIDYLDVFNKIITSPRKYMDHKDKRYGFCISGLCSVKRDCKLKPINDFYKNIDDEIVKYIGIGIDEPKRLESMHKNKNNISLLEKYGLTELDAKRLCEKYDLLSPSYELTKRNGCWFCPNAKLEEHRDIKETMPDIWQQFITLEDDLSDVAHKPWNAYTKQTLHQRDELLKYKQISIFDL